MTAAIVPFPRRSTPAEAAQTRRDTRLKCLDCETLREESERIRRDYEERRKRIERLLRHINRSSERA